MATLSDQVWSREFGAHGPIILATGAWLLWRRWPSMTAAGVRGNVVLTGVIMTLGLALYVFGRAYDFISLETAGVFGVGLAMLHDRFGLRVLGANWFPLLYLGFIVPPPNWLIDQLTAPLKAFVSFAATGILRAFDLPIAREGVTLFVAQYQLLVEDACSGMNSIVGLMAIGLFYIYLVRGPRLWYSMFIAVCLVPIAVAANVIRVIVLVLLTYFYGDEAAQGFLHFTAGMLLFAVALLLVFALDGVIFRFLPKRGRA